MPTQTQNQTNESSQPRTGTSDWDQYATHRGRVIFREQIAERTVRLIVEKPEGFKYQPGQGVHLAIDREGHRQEKHPMFLTSLPHEPRLEMIVHAADGDSGQNQVLVNKTPVGTRLLFDDAVEMADTAVSKWKTPGVFIAGGAGIAAFASLFRHLSAKDQIDGNRLFVVNRRVEEAVMLGELFRCFGHSVTSTLTEEKHDDHEHGPIDREWLEKRVGDFGQPFYLCGPPAMVEPLQKLIADLGGDCHCIPWPGSIG